MRKGVSRLGDPGAPEVFVALLIASRELCILQKFFVGKLEHALRQEAVVLQRREDSEKVGSGDTGARNIRGKEQTLTKGSVCMDIEIFLAFGVRASSWRMDEHQREVHVRKIYLARP